MLRYSNVLWLSCALGITLGGCTTTKDYSNAPKGNVDRYYGSPQTSGSSQHKNRHVTSNKVNKPLWESMGYSTRAIKLKPNAPQRYVVKKGDTLWDIAGVFLKDPAQWPRLWQRNRQIKNPHLIYPGDVLHLEHIKMAARQSAKLPSHYQARSGKSLQPRLRIERRGDRSGQPLNALKAFTVWPQVMSKHQINRAPYLLASRDRSLLITEGERVYVKNLRQAREGQRYAVYHPGRDLRDPETKRVIGQEVSYSGEIRIDRADRLASATVSSSRREIQNGDRILPKADERINLNTTLKAPRRKVRGTIVSLFDANMIQGTHMIAVINRGQAHGLQAGHILGVYDEGQTVDDPYHKRTGKYGIKHASRVYLPPEKVSNLVLYKVDKNLSYGLLMDASREVQNGYKIGNP